MMRSLEDRQKAGETIARQLKEKETHVNSCVNKQNTQTHVLDKERLELLILLESWGVNRRHFILKHYPRHLIKQATDITKNAYREGRIRKGKEGRGGYFNMTIRNLDGNSTYSWWKSISRLSSR